MHQEQKQNDFWIKLRITDKYMKPAHLDFQKTNERISYEHQAFAREFPNEQLAVSGILQDLRKKWKPSKYNIEVLEVRAE